MVTIKCKRCDKEFDVPDYRKDVALYCSHTCRRNRVEKICDICGKHFEITESCADKTFCCGKECGRIRMRRKRQEEIEDRYKQPIYCLLIKMYYIDQLGIKQISKKIGVSDRNLWSWFDELGIERRERSDAVALQWVNNDDRKKEQSERILEDFQTGKRDVDFIASIAKQDWVRKRNSESKQGEKNWMYGRSGSLHHLWNGGKIYYYGPSWNSQRNKARQRDNYTCQRCGITESEIQKELDVHHVVKFRHFGLEKHEQANDLSNLTCLCRTCHKIIEPNN